MGVDNRLSSAGGEEIRVKASMSGDARRPALVINDLYRLLSRLHFYVVLLFVSHSAPIMSAAAPRRPGSPDRHGGGAPAALPLGC
jgi:hypothetical protein